MRATWIGLLALLPVTPALAYTPNVYWWSDDQLPVQVELVRPGSEDLGETGTEDAVLDALEAWSEVACTSLTFEFNGWVDEMAFGDGVVQIEWIEEDSGMKDAAASTAIQPDPEEGNLIDVNISFNGDTFSWVTEGSNPYLDILDTRTVLVHEFGHMFGLDHSEMFEATLFYAYVSATGGYLSWDDKWGICSLYLGDGDECEVDADCPEHPLQDYRCREIEELGRMVCEEVYDGLGACCDVDWNNCADGLCAMHLPGYDGYCSSFCEDVDDCPNGWSCDDLLYLGEPRAWCVSPEGADQPCGDDFVMPDDDDDSAGDDDSASGADDDDDADDDDSAGAEPEDGGCGCRQDPREGAASIGLAMLAIALGYRRR